MKAIIMAGGEGSRLRPLTCDCPKPMLRLMGRPLMEYAVQLLQKHSIHEIAATLGYLPDAIMDYFGDALRFYIEKTPLGTAGSVKQAADFLDTRFIVLSGDGITDFDLDAALRFHVQRGAIATLILKKHPNPREYGMVVADGDGRIRAFYEKPGRSDVYSDRINTGVYILEPELLEYIPDGRPYDFGHDLFPALIAGGLPVYGYTAGGYWCDVGDVGAYLQVHQDAMNGKIALDGLRGSTTGARIEPGCTIESPVYIAPGAHIASGAHIGAGSVIGEGCRVAGGASIKRSILLSGAQVEASAQLRGCVVGTNAVVGERAQLFEESVVGSASRVGQRAILPPGVKLWPEKSLPDGERPDANIVWGAPREMRFHGDTLMLESPAQASRAAEACAAALQPREMIIGRAGSAVAGAMWHAAAAGAMAQGVQLVDAGLCSLPQLRHALCALHGDAALYVREDGIIPLDAFGAPLTEKTQRNIRKLMERQDFPKPFGSITRPMTCAGPTQFPYAAYVAAVFEADADCAPPIVLSAQLEPLRSLAEQVIERAGLQLRHADNCENGTILPGEIGFELDESGENIRLQDASFALNEAELQLARAWTALECSEKRLILPNYATRAIDRLAAEYGAHCVYLNSERAAWLHTLAENAPLQFALHTDGLYFALAFLSKLTDKGLSLEQWRRQMPSAFRSMRNVDVPERENARLLYALSQSFPEAELGGGVRLRRGSGWAWLGTDDSGAQLNIIAEGADMETAREICDFCNAKIQRLLAQKQD